LRIFNKVHSQRRKMLSSIVNNIHDFYEKSQEKSVSNLICDDTPQSKIIDTHYLSFSEWGHSIDLLGSDLLIGAPYARINSGDFSLINVNSYNTHFDLSTEFKYDSRLGTSVKFVDINCDKKYEVVASLPGYGDDEGGRLQIYSVTSSNFNFSPKLVITIDNIGNDWGIGSVTDVGDIDNDGCGELIVGVPHFSDGDALNVGGIMVVYSSPSWSSETSDSKYVVCKAGVCNSTLVKFVQIGTDFWQMAGSSIKIIHFKGDPYVLIGSIGFVDHTNINQSAVGRVVCYDPRNESVRWTVTGDVPNSGFGSSIEADSNYLYVGSPVRSNTVSKILSKGEIGSVYVYNLTELFDTSNQTIHASPITTVTNGDLNGRFGHKIVSTRKTLYVSAPLEDDLSGKVYAFEKSFDETAPTFELINCYTPPKVDKYHSSQCGFGYDLVVKDDDDSIYISAPHLNNRAGGVYVYET
ncbi:putative integrin, partial [Yasminevirus sp. GU-2018]